MLQPARVWLSSANACEYAEQLAHWHTQLAGIVTVNGAIFHGYLQSAVQYGALFYFFDFG
jgi:4-aminobutyrate aminotransferase-like enzyme